MDFLESVITTISMGAAAVLRSDAEAAVCAAYGAVKAYLASKLPASVGAISQLEAKPASEGRRLSLKEELSGGAMLEDKQLQTLVAKLAEVLQSHQAQHAKAIGVELEAVKAAVLRIREVAVEGKSPIGVKIKNAEIAGELSIEGISVGQSGSSKKKTP